MTASKFAYRPEIDGLRAIAVSSVILFHLNRQWLPGGFVGVDIFFVISGYLITSILLQDCKTGQFSLAKFYQRRIARIFPAFFTVALTTVAAAWAVYTPQDFASAGAVLVAASLSIANFKFMFQGNYFEVTPDSQPFLHYWSLSVEEQFYILFPVSIFLLYRFARGYLIAALAVFGIFSFAASVVLTAYNPGWAFYLLPARAWELGAGCIVAALPVVATERTTGSAPGWLAPIGILLIIASFIVIREGAHFPGWIAALPVAGAVAIIQPGRHPSSIVLKSLTASPAVALGKMSYSLYLWHWPVFCLVDYHFFTDSGAVRLLLKIGGCGLLTVLSYFLIETPAREFLNKSSRRLSYAVLIAMLALCVPLGAMIRSNNYVDAELSGVAKGGLVFPATTGGPSVVLMGDSNGSMYGRIMRDVCEELHYNLTVISVAAGDPLPSTSGTSSKLWDDSLAVVRKTKPDYLVLASSWVKKLRTDPGRLANALKELQPYARHIVLLNQPPILPAQASRVAIRNGSRPPFFESALIQLERRQINKFLLSFETARVSVVDIARHFESDSGEIIYIDNLGRLLFQDSDHLSGYGAARIRSNLEMVLSRH